MTEQELKEVITTLAVMNATETDEKRRQYVTERFAMWVLEGLVRKETDTDEFGNPDIVRLADAYYGNNNWREVSKTALMIAIANDLIDYNCLAKVKTGSVKSSAAEGCSGGLSKRGS